MAGYFFLSFSNFTAMGKFEAQCLSKQLSQAVEQRAIVTTVTATVHRTSEALTASSSAQAEALRSTCIYFNLNSAAKAEFFIGFY